MKTISKTADGVRATIKVMLVDREPGIMELYDLEKVGPWNRVASLEIGHIYLANQNGRYVGIKWQYCLNPTDPDKSTIKPVFYAAEMYPNQEPDPVPEGMSPDKFRVACGL